VARPRGFPRGLRMTNRRQTSWDLGPGGAAPTAFSTSTSAFLGSAIAILIDGLTIVRLRGDFMAYMTLSSSALDGFQGAFGIAIANTQAVVAGAASVLQPLTNADWDGWMYHRFFFVKSPSAFSAGGNLSVAKESTVLKWDVDTKAMRKITTDESVYAMLEVAEVGTSGMDVHFDSRMLFKLP